MKHRLGILIFTALLSGNLAGQTTPANNYNNWLTYFGQYKLNPRWAIHFDAQFRADNKVQRVNQSLLRTGAQYFFQSNLNTTIGYAYINSYSQSAPTYFTEHRIWEQLLYNQAIGKASVAHRLRLEQRFVENPADEGDKHLTGHRLRYFNRTIFPLDKKQSSKAAPYLALQDEIFINFASPDINNNVFDQNRFLIAFGILHEKHTRLEIGYMNQWNNPASGANVTKHILHLSVLQVLNFGEPGH